MKNKVLIFLLLFTFSKWGSAQNIFSNLTFWGSVMTTQQFNQSNLLCSILNKEDTSNSFYSKFLICKHTNKGEIIKQLVVYSDSSSGFKSSKLSAYLFIDSLNNIEVYGSYNKDSSYGIFINKYDFELNLISQKVLDFGNSKTDTSENFLRLNNLVKLENGDYWMAIEKYIILKNGEYINEKSYIILVDSDLKIKKTHQENLSNGLNEPINGMVLSPFNSGYLIISKKTQYGTAISLQTFDSNLVLKGNISYPRRNTDKTDSNFAFPNLLSVSLATTNNKLLVTGSDYGIPVDSTLTSIMSKSRIYDPINIFSLNSKYYTVAKKNIIVDWDLIREIELEGDFLSNSRGYRIAISKTNHIYVFNVYACRTKYIDTTQAEPISYTYKYYLVVSKFDNDLNLIWSKRVKNLPNIIFTNINLSQNSIFLVGSEYKGLVNNLEYWTPYVLQLDTFGNLKSGITPINKLANSQVEVYPNPSIDNIFNFEMSNGKMATLAIYSLTGKQVFQTDFTKPTSNFSVNSTDWANGIYFYKISTTNNQNITGKILKQ